jgi:anti-anti-sigma factor
MTTAISICDVECQEDVVVLTPTVNLRELEYDDFEAAIEPTLDMLENGDVKHVIIDFGHTEYFGSHTITSLLKLGKKARCQGGKMALSGLSAHEKEILKAMALDTFWPICSSTEDASEAVKA